MIVKGILYVALVVATIVTGIGLVGWWCLKEYLKIVKQEDN